MSMFIGEGGCSSPEIVEGVLVIFIGCLVWFSARACESNNADLQQPESEFAEAHNVWQYYTVTNRKIVCFIERIAEVRIQRKEMLW